MVDEYGVVLWGNVLLGMEWMGDRAPMRERRRTARLWKAKLRLALGGREATGVAGSWGGRLKAGLRTAERVYAMMSWATVPWTSVRRKSRPAWR